MEEQSLEAYPISVIDFHFTFLSRPVTGYVIASAEYFGVLVSIDNLPPPRGKMGRAQVIERMSNEIALDFVALADDYLETATEHKSTLPLPDPDTIGEKFSSDPIEVNGTISATNSDPPMPQDIRFSGDYLFVREEGVNIADLVTPINKDGVARTLH